jgi:hypothetical protein
MNRFLLALPAVLLVAGCSHYFIDSDVRLQIENDSETSIARLTVDADDGGESVWIADTLAPGARSKVKTGDWVGTFDLGLSVLDSETGTWEKVKFTSVSLDGGSVFVRISEKDGKWFFDVK